KTGKKSLTPDQTREKQLMLSMLDRERDESDRTHPVRLVFEPKTSRVDETEFVNLLLAKTSLETNVPINLVMVGLDGRPTGKNLRDIISEWVRLQNDVAQVLTGRAASFRSGSASALPRLHGARSTGWP